MIKYVVEITLLITWPNRLINLCNDSVNCFFFVFVYVMRPLFGAWSHNKMILLKESVRFSSFYSFFFFKQWLNQMCKLMWNTISDAYPIYDCLWVICIVINGCTVNQNKTQIENISFLNRAAYCLCIKFVHLLVKCIPKTLHTIIRFLSTDSHIRMHVEQ